MPKRKINVSGVDHQIEKKDKNVVVTHPDGKKINLTKVAKVKTVDEGVKATKKWHKENPHTQKKGK